MSALSSNISIPLYQPSAGVEEERLVMAAIRSGYYNEGPLVRKFEKMFADFVGAKYCIFVPNGRIALYLGMIGAGVYREDIFIPAYYGVFAAMAAREYSFDKWEILCADVSKNTACVDDAQACIYTVHANGRIGVSTLIEDCCQAITHHSKGQFSSYSFHSTKMMTCGGIGGALCLDDKEAYELVSRIKDHGRPERAQGKPVTDYHSFMGNNFKMSDINAAFGIAQLEKLPSRLDRFAHIYQVYRDLLGDKVGWLEGAPQWRIDCLVDNPEKVVAELAKFGIQAQRFYLPTYRQPQFRDDPAKFPNCEYLYQHGVYLPSSPELTDNDIAYVTDRIKNAITG